MENQYNYFERSFALWLSKFPIIKNIAKKAYSRLSFLIYRKPFVFKTKSEIRGFCHDNFETFFGYYDKSPESVNGKYVLYHRSALRTSLLPSLKKEIEIVLAYQNNNQVVKSFFSSTYNWQQGAKTQWIDENRFIFNDFDNSTKSFISKLINLKDLNKVEVYPFPIYDTYKEYALYLNFSRLSILRPDYGYRNDKKYTNKDLNNYANDGIFFGNLSNKKHYLLLSFLDICKVEYKREFDTAVHKVNHIMISPDGTKFVFLHRYFINSLKFDRLLISNIDGSNLQLLSDHNMVSHFYWSDNENLIAYMRRFEIGDKYYNVNIVSSEIIPIGLGKIDRFGDGHPNINDYKMLFDTYPNKSRMKELYVFNLKSNNLKNIGEFLEPFKYNGQTRCDLHPRWNFSGNRIYFDSVHTGHRCLFCINLY